MSERIAAISLKIPDNTAFTTLTALRRLGVDVAKLERSDVWVVEDNGEASSFVERMERNETIFNPNKHRLAVLETAKPRAGEAWVATLRPETLGGKSIPGIAAAKRYVGWRMFDENGTPAGNDVIRAAVERLLCNPAIEEAVF